MTIARSMIQEGLRRSTINTPHARTENLLQNEFTGEHFPQEIPRKGGTKRKPNRLGYACNGSWSDINNRILPKRCSRIWCPYCKKVLCATPCFKVFHTNPNYNDPSSTCVMISFTSLCWNIKEHHLKIEVLRPLSQVCVHQLKFMFFKLKEHHVNMKFYVPRYLASCSNTCGLRGH